MNVDKTAHSKSGYFLTAVLALSCAHCLAQPVIDINAGETYGDHRGGPRITFSDITVNLFEGGTLLPSTVAGSGATINVFGGTVDSGYRADAGSITNISGGQLDSLTHFLDGSVVDISGGRFVQSPKAFAGSEVTFRGGDFHFNGQPVVGTQITSAGILSGTYPSGVPFIITGGFEAGSNVSLAVEDLPPVSTTPIIVDGDNSFDGSGLRPGQTLTLRDGGSLPTNFVSNGATLNIEGGVVGAYLDTINSHLSISGGTVEPVIDLFYGTTLDITGGSLASGFNVRTGSTVNIAGGTVDSVSSYSGSTVNLSGGQVLNSLIIREGSTANISGGQIGGILAAGHESLINLSVRQVLLDGQPVEMTYGATMELATEGHTTLEAILAGGEQLTLNLNPHPKDGNGVEPTATLTATLVPEPSAGFTLYGSILLLLMARCHRNRLCCRAA